MSVYNSGRRNSECTDEIATQSPIAINLNECIRLPPPIHLCLIKYFERKSITVVIANTGKTAKVSFPGIIHPPIAKCGPLKNIFQFEHCEFRWNETNENGSEHSLNGKKFACEAQLVHFNKKYLNYKEAMQKEDGLLIIAIFMDLSDLDNNKLDHFVEVLEKIPCKKAEYVYTSKFFFEWLEDVDFNEYVIYKGSMTTHPYFESVTWIIINKPITISSRQMQPFHSLHIYDQSKRIRCNARELQLAPFFFKVKYTGEMKIKERTKRNTCNESGHDILEKNEEVKATHGAEPIAT